MRADGRVRASETFRSAEPAARRSSVQPVQDKQRRSRPLTFVVVYHQILQGGYVVIDEAPAGTREQNLPDKEQFLWNTAAWDAPASRSAAYA
jgi:hydroxyacyl-ACP dehydratase HTD2-like protein with hotdog domain